MSTPLWRQMYNAWEQAVSPPLQELTASNGFRDVLAVALKTNADISREIERASRQWLHLWNLPAATDVRRLRQQVTGLERELLALRNELERQNDQTSTRPTGPAGDKAETAEITMSPIASTNGSNGRAVSA